MLKKLFICTLFFVFALMLFVNCQKKEESPTSPGSGTAATNTPIPGTPTNTLTNTSTNYPTSTPNTTPGGDNVSGTLTLPAPQPGKQYFVIADNDTDGGNGFVSSVIGICGTSTNVNYAFTVPDGTYYLYAAVDINGTGFVNGPVNGDYVGFYGGSGYNPPGSPNAVVSGPSNVFNFSLAAVPTYTPTDTFTPTLTYTPTNTPTTATYGTISGNLILPAAQNGKRWSVLVDNDLNPMNGAYENEGICGSSTTVPYSVTAPAGTYYVYVWVDANGTGDEGADAGDYFGSYGATYPNFPSSPNVTVTNGSSTTGKDITLKVGNANVTCVVNFPADAGGADGACLADNDLDGGNGFLSKDYQQVINGTSYTFHLCVPLPGNYYFLAFIDKVDPPDINSGPQTGDYYGAYGQPMPVTVNINPANSYSFTFSTQVQQ